MVLRAVVLTVRDGAVPAAGGAPQSDERTRTFSINTLPSPTVTIGPAENRLSELDVSRITTRTFSTQPLLGIEILEFILINLM